MITTVTIDTTQAKWCISRHIYGHFAEHLGRCIYDGFWVGEGSAIPNRSGIRDDIVEALRRIRIPNLRWPAAVLPASTIGAMGSGRERSASAPSTATGAG